MRRINLYLPERLIEDLNRIASERGSTFSAMTREVLEAFVESKGRVLAEERPETVDALERIETRLKEQGAHLGDVKAVLDLVLHFAKRSADR
jgi:predicted DNA-binding protein